MKYAVKYAAFYKIVIAMPVRNREVMAMGMGIVAWNWWLFKGMESRKRGRPSGRRCAYAGLTDKRLQPYINDSTKCTRREQRYI
jgi:hypothetical protein